MVRDIVSDYPAYDGETASLSGKVIEVQETSFKLLVRYDGKERVFTVTAEDYPIDIEIGDRIEVLGSLKPNYRILATKIIISKRLK